MRRFIGLAALLAIWAAPAWAHQDSIPHPSLPECIAGDPRLMLPDVVPELPSDVRNSRKGGRRKIEFTTKVGNIGDGALILEGKTISTPAGIYTHAWQIIKRRDGTECARSAGQFVYHPQHTHYHFNRWVSYELRVGDPENGELAGTGYKASFCLLDTENLRGWPTDVYLQTRGLSCGKSEGRQGISVGWQDVYERHLPDQNIDLDGPDPVVPGAYFLVFHVDPEERLWELNRSNNATFVPAGVSLSLPDRNSPARQPPLLPDNAVPVTKPSHGPPGGPTNPPATAPPTQGGSDRPDRPEKPTKAPKPPKTPKPPRDNSERPTRPPKPPRPGRGTDATPVPTPLPTSPGSTPQPTPPSAPGSCNPTCFFSLKQMRMTWLTGTGLSLSGTIDTRGCPTIPVDGVQNGFLNTYNWMTEDFESDTGIQHNATFVIENGAGDTSTGGRFTVTSSNNTALFTYSLAGPPPSNAADGQNFPVVFDLCMGIGDQTIAGRMVCQPKATGMLCHE